jgi:prephenate dehydrogenase
LREILFNPRTGGQVSRIRDELKELLDIIDRKDEAALGDYLKKIREHIK